MENGHYMTPLKADISSFLYIFIMSVRQVFTEIQVVLFTSVMKLDCREHTMFIFFILQKHIVLLLTILK